MPRPPRIEYEGAFHHLINRGRDNQSIYLEDKDYESFLATLAEVTKEYHAVIHAYCLITNHYHLLIETPKANLGQIMKHVNGLYTQRYNRKYKKDGALFRGRYKSILVDEDAYLLQLTRYIHRNPVEVKKKMVKQLSDYRWSSYPAYITQTKAADWLYGEKTYQMLGHRHRYKGYSDFVEKGIDEDIKQFYGKGNVLAVLGDKAFRVQREQENDELDIGKLRLALEDKPTISEIFGLITKTTKKTKKELLTLSKGKRSNFPKRAFAIYICHRYSRADHNEIAHYFGLSHRGSISHPLSRIRKEIAEGLWRKEMSSVEKQLYLVK
ncbi:MAG: transposase [Kangiellaceae bacterium]|nr:transposase [Kangiellaceae bacterium]